MEIDKGKLMQAVTQEKLLEFQSVRYDKLKTAGADRLILDLAINESAGGECPHCRKPWKKVPVSNAFADFSYFDPDCRCYDRCKVCGMSLHGVTFPNRPAKEYKCPRCGHREPERWQLLCRECAQSSIKHIGKPFAYVCNECKSKSKRGKKAALEVDE